MDAAIAEAKDLEGDSEVREGMMAKAQVRAPSIAELFWGGTARVWKARQDREGYGDAASPILRETTGREAGRHPRESS